MGRKKNDGRGRLGGRQVGSTNKASADLKRFITELLEDNREQIREDFMQLSPYERIKTLSQLAGYVIPKQQAVSIEEQQKAEEEALTEWLKEAPEEAINAISAKILEIQQRNKTNNQQN